MTQRGLRPTDVEVAPLPPTSLQRVAVAAVLFPALWVLAIAALTLDGFEVNLVTQPLGALIAVYLTASIARERTMAAVLPYSALWIVIIAGLALGRSELQSDDRQALVIASVVTVSQLALAWWLEARWKRLPKALR